MEILLAPELLLCAALFASAIGMLLFGFPVAFTLAGVSLLFALAAAAAGAFDASFLAAMPHRIFSIMRNEVLIAVPLFVLMGVTLEKSKIAEQLLENLGRLFGTARGGLGYAVCLVGALLAASTGIVGATVVTMGVLALPVMLRHGYSSALACGSICAAGTLGQIIPPSIVLVLLGDQLASAYQQAQYSVGNFAVDTVAVHDLFAGALLPGLMLAALYMAYQMLVAIVHPRTSPATGSTPEIGRPACTGKSAMRALIATVLPPLALIAAVLGSILAGLASPTESAAMGGVGALMMAGYKAAPGRGKIIIAGAAGLAIMLMLATIFDLRLQSQSLTAAEATALLVALISGAALALGLAAALLRIYALPDENGESILLQIIQQTLMITAMIFLILIGASMFALVFRGLGGDAVVENILLNLPGGALTAVLLVMLAMFLLGFVLDFVEIIFIVVPIVAPVLLQMELTPGVPISPIWLGVMLAINIQTSFLTPPFGLSVFYLRGVAPAAVRTVDIYRGCVPFVCIQLLMLAALWLFPSAATWLPQAIYGS